MTEEQPVIRVEGLWKRYGLPLPTNLLQWMPGRWQRQREKKRLPWAIQDLNLTVHTGETLGIIGLNGSGKSTLLKILAGVSPPSQGSVTVAGSLFPMIELNAGIHMDLTGRENVRLLGAVMGLERRHVESNMTGIEAFCELGAWFDRPVRMYSSGMLVRLGFAVGVHVNADILLLDEVLAVGDISFSNKCLRHLEGVRGRGQSILIVSHNLQRIRRMCDRVLVLDQGALLALDQPEPAIAVYQERLRERMGDNLVSGNSGQSSFDFLGVALADISWQESNGATAYTIGPGDNATLLFALRVAQPITQVTLNVALENGEGISIVWETLELPALAPGVHRFQVAWRDLRFKAGGYSVRIGMGAGSFSLKGFRVSQAAWLEMTGDVHAPGLYQPVGAFQWFPPSEASAAPVQGDWT